MQTLSNTTYLVMKRFMYLAMAALFLVGGTSVIQAQSPNLAHLNVSEILQEMPGTKKAQKELQQYAQNLQKQSQSMMQEYQTKMKEFQEKEALMDEATKEVKQQEIQDLQKRIRQFQQSSQQKVAEKRKELYEPIMKKVENAIETVAKRNGYDYVFDTSKGGTVYANEGDNISSKVRAELGLQ